MGFHPEPLTALRTARGGLVLAVVLSTAATLALTVLTVRSILTDRVAQEADAAVVQEVQEFVAFADGAQHDTDAQAQEGSGSAAAETYSSEAELFELFLARQVPQPHEALIGVSGTQTEVRGNTSGEAAERFAESPALERILSAEATSGVQQTEEFGEIRYGRVTTDQDGAMVVLHFTSAAQAEARDAVWTVTWVGLAAMTLVTIAVWFLSGWFFRSRVRTARAGEGMGDAVAPGPRHAEPAPFPAEALTDELHPLAPRHAASRTAPESRPTPTPGSASRPAPRSAPQSAPHPAAEDPGDAAEPEGVDDPTVPLSDLFDGQSHPAPVEAAAHAEPTTVLDLAGDFTTTGELNLSLVSASSLLLRLQREAAQEHLGRRFGLAAGPRQGADDAGLSLSTGTAEVLGELSGIEAELDAEAVRTAMLEMVDAAVRKGPSDAVVVLSGEPAGEDELRLTVAAPEPAQTPAHASVQGPARSSAPALAALSTRWDPRRGSASQTPGSEAGAPPPGVAVETAFFAAADSATSVPSPSRSILTGTDAVATANEVAEAHHGTCWTASEPGLTVRCLQLPLRQPAQEETPEHRPTPQLSLGV